MKMRDVLVAKGPRIVSVQYDHQADQIPTLFDERKISSVIVQDRSGRLLGIVTDRLILKALAGRKPLAGLHAADVMQTPAPSCSPETTVAEAMRKMTDQYVRHLVVLDEGHTVGVVSIGDLVKARLGDYEMESRVLREIALGHMSAQA